MATSGVAPYQVPQDKGETPPITQMFRKFRGVNTKAERSAIPDDTFYDLQNMMPLGDANLHSVPGLSAALYAFGGTNTIWGAQFGCVNSVPYLFCYSTQGNIIAYNLSTSTAAQINGSYTLSNGGVRMAPFYNIYILFIDSTGYYSWNGTTFTLLNGANQPAAGTDIAVFAGSVWVANGRLITLSAAYLATGTTDPTNNSAWLTANGATFLAMTDSSIVGNLTRLWAQNGFLYIFSPTSVWALTDVFVPTNASPPAPVWTLLPVQGIIGTDQVFSVFPLNRALMFASRYGVWAIEGVNATRLSEDLDGTWQYLTFSTPISGGQCVVLNVLNAAFLVNRLNDPILGTGTVVAMWFENKWWFANIGTATFIVSAVVNATPVLFAFIGNSLYQMFLPGSTPPNTQVMTPLWGGDDPLSVKQALKAGFEVILDNPTIAGGVTATLDTFSGSTQLPFSGNSSVVLWINSSAETVSWENNSSVIVSWFDSQYQLYAAIAPAMYSPYIGITVNTTGVAYELDGFYMDVKKRKRW
jgi:hypothetical protein